MQSIHRIPERSHDSSKLWRFARTLTKEDNICTEKFSLSVILDFSQKFMLKHLHRIFTLYLSSLLLKLPHPCELTSPFLPFPSYLFSVHHSSYMNSTVDYMSTIQALKHDLFRDYDAMLAPVHHKGSFEHSFMEKFSMMLTYVKLTSVNERSMEFSLVLGMMLNYNNVSHLYLTLDQLWFPNFHPCESSSVVYLSRDRNQVTKVFPNGDVRTIVQAEITYSCPFDTSLFPFDVQSCVLCFTLNGYDPDDFEFTASVDPAALANDMSEWRIKISNNTESFNYCANDICQTILHYSFILSRNPQFWIGLVIIPIFMLGFLILIGLFFSGKENLVNNAIGFGLTTMMSMMVVVGILNDSLSKIESIPCMGLFVLIQIAVTSVAVVSVLLTDQLRKSLSAVAREKKNDGSKLWRIARKLTQKDIILRNVLFLIFSFLHLTPTEFRVPTQARASLFHSLLSSDLPRFAVFTMNSTVDFMSIIRGLKQDLFRDYDMMLAPVHHRGEAENGFMEQFSMLITFLKLTAVNERSMEFSLVLGMLLMWNDPRLAWNPEKYSNISHLYLALEQFWFPNFHPCESSSITYLSLDRDQVAKVFPNGDVRTILQAEITYSCSFDTALFPFDVQSCALCFALNGYDPDDFVFTAGVASEDTVATDMSEWQVKLSNTTQSFNYCSHDICMTILHYSIVLSRNPQFWIGLVIIPIFMLGFLILIGLFFSGTENLVNNAIGFGLTTMMSMMVVVGILNDSLSKIESIPCMGLFVLIQIAATSIAVIVVLLTDKLRRNLSDESRDKSHDSSRLWRFIRSITREERILRNFLFIVFSILHIANFAWFLSNQNRDHPIMLPPQIGTATSSFV
ncbi:hypothetical protein PRIPAC_77137 [Pristionchus pacificus]|uniref:Transmembrane ion channel n=1 Tax=Pristionchus pacificus TaxID=54126 RepID=A0A2A6CBQ0_PRIPA|nr:hypothetical protein PRIPAC_77137 [Pristionchus pacificus]|eukprot:PDM75546.1 transmembrane ion channel [Pristionchus pacificus]